MAATLGWPLLVHKYLLGKTSQAETAKAKEIIHTWRQRLFDISWFMRCLNEYLARRANEEDQCKGRFWSLSHIHVLRDIRTSCSSEGRYKSQALLGDAAVLTAMSYVDLNPIRAGMAKTPEESDYTSIQQRIQSARERTQLKQETKQKSKKKSSPLDLQPAKIKLMPLVKMANDNHPNAIGYTFKDYLELIDWAGRSVRQNKRGAIDSRLPPILHRLGLDEDAFLEHVLPNNKHNTQPCVLGTLNKIKALTKKWQQKFIKGQFYASRLYKPV